MTQQTKSKNRNRKEGKKFEEDIKKSFEENNLYCLRLKDSASSYSNNARSRFTSTNPSDFISYNIFNGKLLYIECKSTEQTSLPLKNFKEHQIKEMYEVSQKFEYIEAYTFINFRKTENTYCIPISYIYDFYYSLNDINIKSRKSIPELFIKEHSTLILSNKRITRFSYDLYDLFYKIK